MLGLDLHDNAVFAVILAEDGRLLGRAEATEIIGDFAMAATVTIDGAIKRAGASPNAVTTVGIAANDPDSPQCRGVVNALATHHAGPFPRASVMSSGTAAAVAESWLGAARGKKDVVFFGVADHAAAGILRDGATVAGWLRQAPAIAWLALNPVEREDYRKIGCLEAEVAAAGIVRRLIWRIKAGDRSRVQDAAGGDLAAVTLGHVLDCARSGDGVSISVMRDTAKYLGMAAANLVAIAGPEVLVLGGIMASAADLLLEPVRTEIARRLPAPMMQALTVVPASLGADAPAIGAARVAATARP